MTAGQGAGVARGSTSSQALLLPSAPTLLGLSDSGCSAKALLAHAKGATKRLKPSVACGAF
jgi:hypothetical protein